MNNNSNLESVDPDVAAAETDQTLGRLASLRVWVAAIAISALTIFGLWYFAGELVASYSVNALNSGWLLVAFLLLICNQVAGAFRLLLAGDIRVGPSALRRSLAINVIQQMATRLLPMRSSEVVWVYLVSRDFRMKITRSLGLLVNIRIWDLCILLSIIVLVTLIFVLVGGDSGMNAALGFGAGAIILVLLLLPTRAFYRLVRTVSRPARSIGWMKVVRHHLLQLIRAFTHAARRRPLLQLTLAVLGWVSAYGTMMCILVSIGLTLPLHHMMLALTALLVSSSIPLPALGIAGSAELGFAAALAALGLSVSESAGAALMLGVVHAVLCFILGGVWFIGYAAARWLSRRGGRA